MPAEKLSPLDELKKEWTKRIGHIITSEEHRGKGPGFTNSTLNRDVYPGRHTYFCRWEGDLNPLFRDPGILEEVQIQMPIAPPKLFVHD